MDREEIYQIIKTCREYFILDLQNDVFDYLYDKKGILPFEYNEIISHKTREYRVYALLDILPEKGNDTFKLFVNYLDMWYPWVFKKYKSASNECKDDNIEKLTEVLKLGGVPHIPQRHISRKEMLIELKNKLHMLQKGEYIVVHGMCGCGKSTLVAEALQNYSLVFDAFNGSVHWLSVSRSTDELVLLSNLLCQFSHPKDERPLFEDVTFATNFIKQRLNELNLKEILLVLDDVASSSVMQAFDIGCKIVVTTHDKNIMNETMSNVTYIHVNEGFSEDETLSLFKKTVGSDKLPVQAKYIHQICKGFPMTISLISSQLEKHKEDVVHNTERWDFYIKKLKDRSISAAIGRYDHMGSKAVEYLSSAIGMCIETLELKEYYQQFALFQDDVNIKPEVLCVLWDLPKKEVEDIMLQFESKSLSVRLWNQLLSSYVYSIHDLLLNYLKDQLPSDKKVELHLKLINQYKKKFGNFCSFPRNDNYILLYLGYHLKEAGLYDEFPRLYLDLLFVETKIKANGPGDLLLDYKKYRDLICNTQENKKKCEDFEWFVNWAGIRIYKSTCDIIQFGLQEVKNSSVYKQAIKMAKSVNKKYFQFLTEPPEAPSYHHCREEIITAIFTLIDQNVLISNTVGDVKLVDVKHGHTISTYKGHTEKVTHLSLCPRRNFFLSGSDDSTVRVWRLDKLSGEENCSDEPRTPSPSFRQDDWIDPWIESRPSGEKPIMELAKHNLPITDAKFSGNDKWIVTASQDCTIRIWTIFNDQIVDDSPVIKTGDVVVSCCFNCDNSLVICALRNGCIKMYSTSTNNEYANIPFEFKIQSLMLLPGEQCTVLILNRDYVSVSNIEPATSAHKSQLKGIRSLKPIKCKRDDSYICANISYDSQYVAIASTNYNTVICEIATGTPVFEFHETNGLTRSLNWSARNLVLMAAYDNKTLKFWNLEQNSTLRNSTRLKQSVFDAVWIDEGGIEYITAAALTMANTIEVFSGGVNDKETIKPKITNSIISIALSPLDGNIVYCCDDGSVYLIVYDDFENTRFLFKVECEMVRKLKLFIMKNDLLVITILTLSTTKVHCLTSWIQKDYTSYEGTVLTYGSGKDNIFDFFLHPIENRLFTVLNNHTVQIYNSVKGLIIDENRVDKYGNVTVCDYSTASDWICSGNDNIIILYKMDIFQHTVTYIHNKIRVCKFSSSGKYLAVGCNNGAISIMEVKKDGLNVLYNGNFGLSSIIDIIWNLEDTHLLIILDRDIVLTNMHLCGFESHLYLTVDKVVPSHSFDKFLTVESNGHLHIFNRPL